MDGTAENTATPEKTQPERLITALRGAERRLAGRPKEATLGERWESLSAAAAEADLSGDVDIYGDGVVADLEARVAALLGKEAAAFFPTGTMAQQVALRCWAGRTGNSTVALHPLAHPEVHEREALTTVAGLRTVHPTRAARQIDADDVHDMGEPFGTLMLELPLRDAGFVLPTWEELEEVCEAARARDAVIHFDGARLWETTVHFGRPLDEIAELADSVYVSFYKSLGGLSGAVLAGPESFVGEARAWRHRYGGQVFQQFPQAIAALAGLERELPRLPDYVAHARVVAQALREGFAEAGVAGARVFPEVPHTHQFRVWLPYDAEPLTEAGIAQAQETRTALFAQWSDEGSVPGFATTEVTVAGAGLEWGPDDVRAAVADFVGRIPW
ncbi:aminotransferase class I/II-fold pyridoxal phosphate-dependent enzyme [Streptomyces sp. NBC_00006]|uniref:threonine aldolase family protein n=1 Tax=Streptomyces sp. NBC_00006 TaxID=2975619 RepID=UPI00225BD969|nr:beta-eliminating lyase-related protein [Streptomyces sp. NBC_00006]MCX5532881.1 aminotransferase class I/II-fold pyridoxal phosphate-dependent enzyme [Streptomyces sp. NBC_00006]